VFSYIYLDNLSPSKVAGYQTRAGQSELAVDNFFTVFFFNDFNAESGKPWKSTHQELFPSGVESGPGHHLPKAEVVAQHCRTLVFFTNQALRGFFCVLCKTFTHAKGRTCPRFTQNLHRGLHTLDSVGDKAHLQDLDSPDVPGNRD